MLLNSVQQQAASGVQLHQQRLHLLQGAGGHGDTACALHPRDALLQHAALRPGTPGAPGWVGEVSHGVLSMKAHMGGRAG